MSDDQLEEYRRRMSERFGNEQNQNNNMSVPKNSSDPNTTSQPSNILVNNSTFPNQSLKVSSTTTTSKPTKTINLDNDEEYARKLQQEWAEDDYYDDEDYSDEEEYSALGNHPIFSGLGQSMLVDPLLRNLMNNPTPFSQTNNFSSGFHNFLQNAQFQTDDYDTLLRLDEINTPVVSKGATKKDIAAIGQTREFHINERKTSSSENLSCGICLEEYVAHDIIKTLNCAHLFHKKCVDKWLEINKICPICRTDQFKK